MYGFANTSISKKKHYHKLHKMVHNKNIKLLIINSVSIRSITCNIVAAFWGMHVSPAKHSYAGLPRKRDYRTDRHTDRQTPDKVIPMCHHVSQVTQKVLLIIISRGTNIYHRSSDFTKVKTIQRKKTFPSWKLFKYHRPKFYQMAKMQ